MISKEEANPLQKFTPSIVTAHSAVVSILPEKKIMNRQSAYIFDSKDAAHEGIWTKTSL
ncbi:hypothetical protein ACP3T3_22025 [Chryseobacterium sp. CBSDS_008]|uniref:hypothetical protein n=1 Tax=Chryseobacterium sp. CBSDS_008 TaxID=3415265 RepID=UPI003CE7FA7F